MENTNNNTKANPYAFISTPHEFMESIGLSVEKDYLDKWYIEFLVSMGVLDSNAFQEAQDIYKAKQSCHGDLLQFASMLYKELSREGYVKLPSPMQLALRVSTYNEDQSKEANEYLVSKGANNIKAIVDYESYNEQLREVYSDLHKAGLVEYPSVLDKALDVVHNAQDQTPLSVQYAKLIIVSCSKFLGLDIETPFENINDANDIEDEMMAYTSIQELEESVLYNDNDEHETHETNHDIIDTPKTTFSVNLSDTPKFGFLTGGDDRDR